MEEVERCSTLLCLSTLFLILYEYIPREDGRKKRKEQTYTCAIVRVHLSFSGCFTLFQKADVLSYVECQAV